MDIDKIPHYYVDSVSFRVFSTEELLKQSVLNVTQAETFDVVGHPTKDGLHDALLGPSNKDELCATCGLGFIACPGHIGHISLPLVSFNPMFFRTLHKLIRGSCFGCKRLLAPPFVCQVTLAQLQVLDYGCVGAVQELQEIAAVAEDPKDLGLVLKNRIDAYVKSVIQEVDPEEARHTSRVKNVVECRQRLIKAFVRDHLMGAPRKCMQCKAVRPNMTVQNESRLVFASGIETADKKQRSRSDAAEDGAGQTYLTPLEARKHLRAVWEQEKPLLERLFGVLSLSSHECPLDMFFLEALVVPPTRFRPMSFMSGRKYEHPQTQALSKVIQCCNALKAVLRVMHRDNIKEEEVNEEEMQRLQLIVDKLVGKDISAKLHFAWNALQVAVNAVFDSDLDKINLSKVPGIKQILEKKEGLFRKHMMGKRVNYAARSVISPDPYIGVEEIGVPMVFAKRLSYPEPVNDRNVTDLRRAVINGPNVYPGALLVEGENGSIIRLDPANRVQREAVAKQLLTPSEVHRKTFKQCKTVHRHLRTGDMLLLNRQPTLHKPSIMAHRARVLPGEKTLRLHYANCKCYNADFDGDEMNAHFPQSELARAEAEIVANVNKQYLVPKDGTPLSGLIQDHVIGGSLLTMKSRFFDRQDYNGLVFGALPSVGAAVKLLPPALRRPVPLWTGKQVLSTVLINCIPEDMPPPTVEGKSKIPAKAWGITERDEKLSEGQVIIRDGELLCGILDKAHYGPTQFGLVHICYELYGGTTSSLVLTAFARLFTHYLQLHVGFTLGIEDILVTRKADRKRTKIMKQARMEGDSVAKKALGIEDGAANLKGRLQDAHLAREDRQMKQLDASMKSHTDQVNNDINKACIPDGLLKKFPSNNLQLMVQSGAKGGMVNCMQISCLLGQIELEGRRVPLMASGRTLPSFLPYDTSPRAGGFVDGRFLTGIRPQEFFFHCMAGREGLVDTAVKTSRSGYLQRCLIKHLEGLMVCYDQTVRDSDGSVIQFQYGEDGLDVLKMQMLKVGQFPVLVKNSEAVLNRENLERCMSLTDADALRSAKKAVSKWKRKLRKKTVMRDSAFTMFCRDMGQDVGREELCDRFFNLDQDERWQFEKSVVRHPDPVSSVVRSDLNLGAVSERMDALIEDYISRNPHSLLVDSEGERKTLTSEDFRNLLYLRNMHAVCDPGEPVGLLAAQSIGEPSTQMTLNTFHFAGRGEMNVTLGIPRMREILMVASANIATPTMDLHLLPVPNVEELADNLRIRITSVKLAQVLECVDVRESLVVKGKTERYRHYRVHFRFLPRKAYRKTLCASPQRILRYMEMGFLRRLLDAIKRKLEHVSSTKMLKFTSAREHKSVENEGADEAAGQQLPVEDDGGESSDEGEGEGDTVDAKARSRHAQEQEYEEAEDEEREAQSDAEEEEETPEDGAGVEDDTKAPSPLPIEELDIVQTRAKAVRVNSVLQSHPWMVGYDYDTKKEGWCTYTIRLNLMGSKLDMTSLVEEEAKKAVLHAVPNITRAFMVKDTKDTSGCGKMLQTEGVNFVEMFKYYNVVDMRRIYSNDIHAIANTFGIEAARMAIVREVANVFAVYGIEVDPRHLLLVADYMTFDGTYRACNRIAMENNASPLQQMTFETTMNFLKSATLSGVQDQLKSPSSRLVLGRVVTLGTGCMDLRNSL
ncbi:DNA-directed RNA polymerase I subunit RPA1-like [Ornithodoros turicata]|uniref:DNA-directed RNA polymerase I subunit RPA1-like n=1 Tax=Ornithodoros turicata TaxID=34597 RepID=UPI00313912B5